MGGHALNQEHIPFRFVLLVLSASFCCCWKFDIYKGQFKLQKSYTIFFIYKTDSVGKSNSSIFNSIVTIEMPTIGDWGFQEDVE